MKKKLKKLSCLLCNSHLYIGMATPLTHPDRPWHTLAPSAHPVGTQWAPSGHPGSWFTCKISSSSGRAWESFRRLAAASAAAHPVTSFAYRSDSLSNVDVFHANFREPEPNASKIEGTKSLPVSAQSTFGCSVGQDFMIQEQSAFCRHSNAALVGFSCIRLTPKSL